MSVNSVCILGGTGFVGSALAGDLNTSGLEVKVLTRRRERNRHLLVLPKVQLIEADVHDPAMLAHHFRGCDAVINLVGILNERGHDGKGFEHAHVALARKVLQACQDAGVVRLLHMSALNADALHGPSHYQRTKGEAENYVHDFAGERLVVTSFRPSVIFGPDDSFINRFATLLKLSPGVFPLACPDARFAPVYVGDVSDAFVRTLKEKSSHRRRIDLCGPRDYTLKALVEYTAQVLGLKRRIIGLPDTLSHLQAQVLEYVPGKPFSLDNYRSLSVDSVCKGGERCPTSLESIAPYYLGKKGKGARYQKFRGEYRE